MNESKQFVEINGKKFNVLYTRTQIAERTAHLANRINADYSGKSPVFLVILKGAVFFASDLLRKIELDCSIETIKASSYGMEMQSSGSVDIAFSSNIDIKSRDVIVIEDIVDTGRTIKELLEKLAVRQPASLEIAAFLSKPEKREFELNIKYLGFEIPPAFVVGYGLDYAEKGRNLPDIYILSNE